MLAPKVLVVDDHAETLEVLEFVLKLAGFEVTTRVDGPSALRTELGDYAAVITDLAMPGMDGAELVRSLRSRMHRPVPVMVLTGQGIPCDALDCPSCIVLRKPTLPDDLTRTLRWLLDSCTHDCESCANRHPRTPVLDAT
jgi:CheY-like chemotaxis protein